MPKAAGYLADEQLSEVESRVLEIYDGLKELSQRNDCPPCVLFSVRQALAAMYPAVNDLGLKYEYLYEYGV